MRAAATAALLALASCSYSALRDGPGTQGTSGDGGSGGAGTGAAGTGATGTGAGPGQCREDGFACGSPSDCCSGVCTDGQCGTPLCLPGDPPVALAEGYTWPYGLALYGPHVYFPDYDTDGGIYRVPRAGGTVETLHAPSDFPAKLAVDDQGIYIAGGDSGQVQHLAFGASQPTALASGQAGPTDVALDETHVWFVSHLSDTIRRVPRGGGQVATISGSPGNFRMTVTDDYVYWGGYDGAFRSPKDGSFIELLSPGGARTLVARDGFVFWTEDDGARVVAYDESAETLQTLSSVAAFPDGIAVDDTHVYYTLAEGSVWRVPRAGGDAEHIATTLMSPTHIVVDSSCVYWSENDFDVGRVMRAPKN